MGRFRLRISAQAQAALLRLAFPLRRQVNHAVCRLKDDPFPDGCESFGGGRCRMRVHGCRVLYLIDDEGGGIDVYEIG